MLLEEKKKRRTQEAEPFLSQHIGEGDVPI